MAGPDYTTLSLTEKGIYKLNINTVEHCCQRESAVHIVLAVDTCSVCARLVPCRCKSLKRTHFRIPPLPSPLFTLVSLSLSLLFLLPPFLHAPPPLSSFSPWSLSDTRSYFPRLCFAELRTMTMRTRIREKRRVIARELLDEETRGRTVDFSQMNSFIKRNVQGIRKHMERMKKGRGKVEELADIDPSLNPLLPADEDPTEDAQGQTDVTQIQPGSTQGQSAQAQLSRIQRFWAEGEFGADNSFTTAATNTHTHTHTHTYTHTHRQTHTHTHRHTHTDTHTQTHTHTHTGGDETSEGGLPVATRPRRRERESWTCRQHDVGVT